MEKIYKLITMTLLLLCFGTSASWGQTDLTSIHYKDGNNGTLTPKPDYGASYYGNFTPRDDNGWADLTSYSTLLLKGEPGPYRIFFNRTNDEVGYITAIIGATGFVNVELDNFRNSEEHVHINGIKAFADWDSSSKYINGVPTLEKVTAIPGGCTISDGFKMWDFRRGWTVMDDLWYAMTHNGWTTSSTTVAYQDHETAEALTAGGQEMNESKGLKVKGKARVTSSFNELQLMTGSEIHIPVSRGSIVMVTGKAEGAARTFSWGNVKAQPSDKFSTGSVTTLSAVASDNGYVTINTGTDGRWLHIYKIEVYPPASGMCFANKGVVLRNNENYYQQALTGGFNPTYSCETKGELKADINIDSSNGNVSNISRANDNGGGAVVVTASCLGAGRVTGQSLAGTIYQEGTTATAQYVITVPYKTHEWSFYSATTKVGDSETKEQLYANTGNASDWCLTWKIRRYDDDAAHTLYYIVNSVMASNVPVESDNARFLDASAGLLVNTNGVGADNKGAYGFGTNIATTNLLTSEKDPANSALMNAYTLVDSYDPSDAMTIRNGSTLTIPELKKGQHIRFRWNRYSTGGVGDKMLAQNVTDLNGTSMNNQIFFLGSGSNNLSSQAHQEFIVENDGDVSFTLSQDGWADIYNIKVGEVGEFLDTDLNIAIEEIKGEDNPDRTFDMVAGNYHVDLYTYLRKAGETDLATTFTDKRGQIHLQSSLDQVFEIENRTGTLTNENCYMSGNKLVIKKGAHGRFTLIEKGLHRQGNNGNDNYSEVQHPYLLDSIHVEVRVYEYDYNVKPYPYTWAMEHFTNDTGNNTTADLKTDANKGGAYDHYWTMPSNYQFRIGYPENLIAWKKNAGSPTATSELSYAVKTGDRMVGGQRDYLYNGNEAVATVIYGGRGSANTFKVVAAQVGNYTAYNEGNTVNGDKADGTYYTIIPKYDGKLSFYGVANSDKQFYVTDNGTALSGYDGKTFGSKQIGILADGIDVKEGHHYKFYMSGSKLGFAGFTYTGYKGGENYVPELDGLGIMPENYWDESDTHLQLEPTQNGLIFSNDKVYKVKVPNVKQGETVYVAATGDTDNSSVAVGSATNYQSRFTDNGEVYYDPWNAYINSPKLNVYKIEGTGGDIDLYLKNMTVHKIAVSTDSKNVSAAGYATEAREYPLDFTLSKTFTGKEQKAFIVTGVNDNAVNVQVAEVKYVPMNIDGHATVGNASNNGVMVTGDFVNRAQATTWPLFTTDINRTFPDMTDNKLIGINRQANVDANVEQREIIDGEKYYNYMLAVNGYNVEYEGDPEETTGSVVNAVSGLGYYLVLKTGTQMLNGSTYPGGKPKDNSSYLHINEKLAKINTFNASTQARRAYPNANSVNQVFFIDADGIATGIEEIEEDATAEESAASALANGVFYTLQGVAVKNPTKGIYILNGKKVYVK